VGARDAGVELALAGCDVHSIQVPISVELLGGVLQRGWNYGNARPSSAWARSTATLKIPSHASWNSDAFCRELASISSMR